MKKRKSYIPGNIAVHPNREWKVDVFKPTIRTNTSIQSQIIASTIKGRNFIAELRYFPVRASTFSVFILRVTCITAIVQ
ncbi:hypothetical protein RCIX2212 [Methanocella arvoryzae MRE50]|uniref:Uncharacterized protein n=1 Tax=Methanocella arvoryzae (strain DSM 22066 / NBRC 105507 / MRE50) TaxID=351160 RepID=Q0W2R2_METAR|nr:hypothetical protein RCIX2212 [Methanocella arvoryzae MRE50]